MPSQKGKHLSLWHFWIMRDYLETRLRARYGYGKRSSAQNLLLASSKLNTTCFSAHADWDALATQGMKQPSRCFEYIQPLIGQKMDSPLVKKFQTQFPQYKLEEHADRGTVMFKVGDESYSIEEFIAMILEYAVCARSTQVALTFQMGRNCRTVFVLAALLLTVWHACPRLTWQPRPPKSPSERQSSSCRRFSLKQSARYLFSIDLAQECLPIV